MDDKRERALKEANYERCSAGFNIAGGMFSTTWGGSFFVLEID